MHFATVLLSTLLTLQPVLSLAVPEALPLTPDPAGDKNIGNGHGTQFITGACLSNADCASGCCARLNGGGICSGPAVGNAQGKQGCGFSSTGDAGPAAAPAAAAAAPAPAAAPAQSSADGVTVDTSIPGAASVGKANGQQFITGQCTSNADCASGCCAGLPTANKGPTFAVCSGPAVGNAAGKTGCGFTVGGGAPAAPAAPAAAPAEGSAEGSAE